MEKNQKRHLRMYIVIAVGVSVSVLVALSLSTMDGTTRRAVSRIDVMSFMLVLALVCGRWLAECFRFKLIINGVGRHLPLKSIVKSVLGSAFAGTVTPYRAGTLPMQAFFFSQYGLTGGEAAAVATTGAALSVLLLTVSVPMVLLVTSSRVHVGFGVRAILVAGAVAGLFVFLLTLYWMKEPGEATRMLGRLVPARRREKPRFKRFEERLARGIEDFSSSLHRLLHAPRATLAGIVALTLAFWFSEVLTGPLILRGLGYGRYFWQALLAELVISAVLPFTPVPGESGVAEVAFAGIFVVFIPRNTVALVTVAWRFFEFYVPLLVLGIAFVLAMNDVARRRARERSPAPSPAPGRL